MRVNTRYITSTWWSLYTLYLYIYAVRYDVPLVEFMYLIFIYLVFIYIYAVRYDVPQVEFMYLIFICMPGIMCHKWSLCTLYFHACQVRVTVGNTGLCYCTCVMRNILMEFMYLVFTRMPGESYRRQHRSLLLYLCYVF